MVRLHQSISRGLVSGYDYPKGLLGELLCYQSECFIPVRSN